MDLQYLQDKIDKGEFEIERRSECDCDIRWQLDSYDDEDNSCSLICDEELNYNCLAYNAVIIDDTIIASFDTCMNLYYDYNVELSEETEKKLEEGIEENGYVGQHGRRRYRALIDFLVSSGYKLGKINGKFLNTYKMTLARSSDPNYRASENAAIMWADEFLFFEEDPQFNRVSIKFFESEEEAHYENDEEYS